MRRSTAILLAGVLLAGCGATTSAGHFQGEQSTVAKAIDDFSSAASSRDSSKICGSSLAPALVAKLNAAGGCTKILDKQLGNADTYTLTTQSVSITGAAAQARVKSTRYGKDTVDALALAKGSDGRWRITGLG
ncbi:MAG: hypothetical protein NVSMB51_17090 [Solirubrobacteraceae bacterium]